MVTEDDLNYYYMVVETLWLGGTSPTIEQIRTRLCPTERDNSRVAEGLAELIARQWLKVEQIPIRVWDTESIFETWYVPIWDHLSGTQ